MRCLEEIMIRTESSKRTMFNLLYKELRLAAHPNLFIFTALGVLKVIVPAYPYGNGIFIRFVLLHLSHLCMDGKQMIYIIQLYYHISYNVYHLFPVHT